MNLKIVKKAICAIAIAMLFVFQACAQHQLTGLVSDASGSPIIGASIVIKGSTIGTVTDINGKFLIKPSNQKNTLVFSFIGYTTKEIEVFAKDSILNVVLAEDKKKLDEVVVVGYGTARKSKISNAISSVFKRGSEAEYDKCMAAPQTYSQTTYYNPSEESYSKIHENGFKNTTNDPLSTFSIDVDKASYSNIKRFINQGQVPPVDAVRIEEMINYFDYDYPQPTDNHPFSITTEYSDCPWQEGHKLLHIGLQGKKIATDNLPPSNLVFLIDVSGSMDEPNKLPLVKSAFKLLVNNLREKDKVAIVVYAGAAGVILPSTKGSDKNTILNALNSLQAGGSTAGCEGIELAYKIAKENFIKEGNNRVILATDGDFNVGISSENDLENFIVEKRKSGIFLTCCGFGMGNYKDSKIELLSDKGNGNYGYINDIMEANKMFVSEFGGTLFTIAKDVKIQIEFNPNKIAAYRLVGYEKRMLNNEDFKDDTKDAGELGSGHTVTALYEVVPVGVESKYVKNSIPLKYQKNSTVINNDDESGEIATVKFRYKKPDGDKSIEMVHPIYDTRIAFDKSSNNLRFSASVAMFGMLLRDSEYKGSTSYNNLIEIADNARGKDKEGYRGEFIRLIKTASSLDLKAQKN